MSKASGQPGMIPAVRIFRDHFTLPGDAGEHFE